MGHRVAKNWDRTEATYHTRTIKYHMYDRQGQPVEVERTAFIDFVEKDRVRGLWAHREGRGWGGGGGVVSGNPFPLEQMTDRPWRSGEGGGERMGEEREEGWVRSGGGGE